MNLFDDWNYDDFVEKHWHDGDYTISAMRDGKLYFAFFNYNPAVFALEAVIIDWEQFLDGGPPVATSRTGEIRAHLQSSRAPGRSTYLILPADGPWLVDGRQLAQPDLPGIESAGVSVWDDRSAWKGRKRVLVTPGEHRVTLPPAFARTVHVARGERREVSA